MRDTYSQGEGGGGDCRLNSYGDSEGTGKVKTCSHVCHMGKCRLKDYANEVCVHVELKMLEDR